MPLACVTRTLGGGTAIVTGFRLVAFLAIGVTIVTVQVVAGLHRGAVVFPSMAMRQSLLPTNLLSDAGLGVCNTTWPGLLPATAMTAYCPWADPWPSQFTATQQLRSGVSASLTTYVARWKASPLLLISAVWSLLNQTLPPDVIYIAMPTSSRGVSGAKEPFPPAAIALLSALPRVHLLRSPDYGPASKFIAPLSSSVVPRDTRIFVCDDDRRYPPKLLQELMRWASLPAFSNSTLGVWGVRPLLPNQSQPIQIVSGDDPLPVRVSVLRGTTGYLVPKAAFVDDLAPFLRAPPAWVKPFWTEDDEWFACHALRVSLPMFVVPGDGLNPGVDFGNTRAADGSWIVADGCDFGGGVDGVSDCIQGTADKERKRVMAMHFASTCAEDPCSEPRNSSSPEAEAACIALYDPERNTHGEGL